MTVLIVTGTGTGVGKTVVTAGIAACASGSVAVVKPAQTGVGPREPGDLSEVHRLSGCSDLHEFARYPDPLSPQAAARRSGLRELDLSEVAERVDLISATRDLVLVEGAGGLLVPMARDGWTMRDLAFELEADVVLVVTAGLGTLNHTALTLEAMDGLNLAGLIIGAWPSSPGLAERCNAADLRRMSPPHFAGAVPDGISRVGDCGAFTGRVRPWLAPEFGGTFDGAAFVATVTEQEKLVERHS